MTALSGEADAAARIALGASLIAISPQRPDDSLSFAERLDLDFDVLSDPDQQTITDYRLHFQLPEELRDLHRQMGMGLDEQNADGSWNLPVPATFVLDRTGTVRAAHVDTDYKERMSAATMLEALQALR
ncbi:MAG: redoxin domain-containing protein [Acidimicrobiia bacterium]|nr:redoxin domain-containing protein [Acidimicrobiia bacterium]